MPGAFSALLSQYLLYVTIRWKIERKIKIPVSFLCTAATHVYVSYPKTPHPVIFVHHAMASTEIASSAGLSIAGATDDLSLRNTYLAMCWSRSLLGFATYKKDSGEVAVGECREFESFLSVLELKEETEPHTILLPSDSDRRFGAVAQRPLVSGLTVELRTLHNEFNAASCLEKLVEALQKPRAVCEQILRSVGADATGALKALSGLLAGVVGVGAITSVKTRTASQAMAVDPTSLAALQVSKRVAHPSAHHGIGDSKEGLSIHGLLHMCKTKMGSAVLKQWMQTPTMKLDVLEKRLNTIDVLVAPHNKDIVVSLQGHLKNMCDPVELLKRFRCFSQTVPHWHNLVKVLYSYPSVVDVCRRLHQQSECTLFHEATADYNEEVLGLLLKRVLEVVDLAQSQGSGRVIIKWGVDAELDRHKEAYEGLSAFLDSVAQSVAQEMVGFTYPVAVDYYPQLGYFVTVPVAHFNEHLTTDLPSPSYTFQFKSEEKLFYKSERMAELDDKYGDLYSAIVDMESEIECSLATFVVGHQDALAPAKKLAVIDCLQAMATVSKEEKWCRPTLSSSSVLHIVDGRHPLQEKVVDAFVPNDTHVDAATQRLHIITGPNASGKSVYLKQIALVVYLAHLGCYVPAREAQVGLTDRIFTRIRSKAGVSSACTSAFSSDLADLKDMILYGTARSLLVIDEFGKGTVTADGIALLASVIRYFVAKGVDCPKVFISTHYVELLEARIVDPSNPVVSVCHMSVDKDLTDVRELLFRYKLKPGVAASSHATYCAAQAGVPADVVARADHLHSLLQKVSTPVFRRLLAAKPDALRTHTAVLRLLDVDLESCSVEDIQKRIAALISQQA